MEKLLYAQFQKTEKLNRVVENLNNNKCQLIQGINEEGLAYLCCNLNDSTVSKILIITNNETKSRRYEEYIKSYTEATERFSAKEFILYNVDALSRDIVYKRAHTLDKILSSKKFIVIASVNSIMTKIMSKERFKESIIKLEYGKSYDLEKLKENLIGLKYERVDSVEGVGQFSVRGGIVDIFSPSEVNPSRIEFFDDEIDSIRTIDLKTQRSVKNQKTIKVIPCGDILFSKDEIKTIRAEVEADYNNRLEKLDDVKENREISKKLKNLYNSYITTLDQGMSIENSDLILPFCQSDFTSILEYFDKDSVIVVDEPERVFEEIKIQKESFQVKYQELFEKGEVFTKQSKIYIDAEDIKATLNNKRYIAVNSSLNKTLQTDETVQMTFKEAGFYYGKMEDLSKNLNKYKYKGYKTVLVLSSTEGCKKLHSLLLDYECSTVLVGKDSQIAESGQIILICGNLKKGFEYPENKILVLTENEIFGTVKKKTHAKKKAKGSKIDVFTDLKIGDYVVHEHHGIGQYAGIEKIDVQNVKKDYLCIKYKGEDKLYVPVDQMSLIQKYIGSDAAKPKVNKMGSGDWVKTKERTKKAIENMASDLVKLYAERTVVKGFAFSRDTEWQKEFEYKFPFDETNDQLRCIEEIKRDMEKQQSMERLLCGDVGFGKTEVAMRAAFKAVMDGKQVAILVPTTILAQQHYTNLVDRFRGYPIKIEMLSRFRTPHQQTKIINEVNKGLIDIIVGTHKILSKDLKFKDLGLLVIDEEQRFGVKHKEMIKQMKASIDVLTLSATPIPRTLHMSMIGVRDMSVIEEPPGDRLPIQTYVIEYNEGIIKDAIEKELSRGGQVYYVHNKVVDIDSVASKLQKLVPEARIAVGHGQMGERMLENIMLDFVNKEYDILVCTTIIETGMDIPNANTLIINNADHLGLSQLYQLRGRIGRSNKVSFAYLTYEKDKMLSEVSQKRLKAIKEFTEFGSGFKIAMRDLEIRGCGNILGAEQSGHMMAIGYDLYVKFLERAVRALRGSGDIVEEVEISVDLSVDGYIPSSYIENEELKIEIYKKIAATSSKEDILDITEEIIDRFGNPSKEVNNLLEIAYLKVLCKNLNIKAITQAGKTVSIEFILEENLNSDLIGFLVNHYRDKVKFDVSKGPVVKYQLDSLDQNKVLKELESVFENIKNYKAEKKLNKEEQ